MQKVGRCVRCANRASLNALERRVSIRFITWILHKFIVHLEESVPPVILMMVLFLFWKSKDNLFITFYQPTPKHHTVYTKSHISYCFDALR